MAYAPFRVLLTGGKCLVPTEVKTEAGCGLVLCGGGHRPQGSFAAAVGPVAQEYQEYRRYCHRPVGENQL